MFFNMSELIRRCSGAKRIELLHDLSPFGIDEEFFGEPEVGDVFAESVVDEDGAIEAFD